MSIGKNSLARAAAATAARPVAEEVKAPAQFGQVEVGAILPLKGKKITAAVSEELAASVEKYGVVEPLLVARTAPEELRMIAGSRRLCAARQVGLATVPALIMELTVAQATALQKELSRFATAPAEQAGTVEATAVGQAMPPWLL